MGKYLDVGLTGGIACGKSLVLEIFQSLGCHTFDADAIYHDLISAGRALHNKLVREFGERILTPSGEIDRSALGKIVFNDAKAMEQLNGIAHPAVVKEQNRLKKNIIKKLKKQGIDQAVLMTSAALMIEAGTYTRYDRIVVVSCKPEVQTTRLVNSRSLSVQEAQKRLASQMPVVEKETFADYVIENNGTVESLIRRVEEVYHLLTEECT
jgi:dephospho-CoA kinase